MIPGRDELPTRCQAMTPGRLSPFEADAETYDRRFTWSIIGRLMRQAVWKRLEECFQPGDRLLELNCGTGEDAIYLGRRGIRVLATDAAPAMLQVAGAKVAQAGLAEMVSIQPLDLEHLGSGCDWRLGDHGEKNPVSLFDGALSNFGGLNCASDLPGVAAGLAACLRPGAQVLLCIMGPLVPWEWVWFLAKGEPRQAFRRLRREGALWRGLRIRYPSIGKIRKIFAAHFRLRQVRAIGALLPPPYTEDWAGRHPHLLSCLNRWERRLERIPPLPWLADHYLMELERR